MAIKNTMFVYHIESFCLMVCTCVDIGVLSLLIVYTLAFYILFPLTSGFVLRKHIIQEWL